MHIGFLTAVMKHYNLNDLVKWASKNGFSALEVMASPGSPHIDPSSLNKAQLKEIGDLFEGEGVRISSLACYINPLDEDPEKRQACIDHMKRAIEVCAELGVEVFCTMAGMPLPGKDRIRTIKEDAQPVLSDLVSFAKSHNVKIALENWTRTLILNLACWDTIFELIPDENFGLNFDPSHLYWQGIDYLWAVEKFKDRIFHVHAKDTEVKEHRLRYLGNQASGWWRYCIPGYGNINWAQFIAALKGAGYNGVLSIEHEDALFRPEEGLLKGRFYLEQLI